METADTPLLLVQCKANQSLEDVSKAITNLLKIQSPHDFNIHISLPYSFMEPISKKFANEKMHIGAENLLDTDEGSFTGSIAGKMLKEAKAAFVLIGTAQDRTSHSATSNHLKNKVKSALENNVHPFVCIGETLQEHQDKTAKNILISQLKDCLEGLSEEELKNIHLVYNAEWISRTPWEAESPELQEAYNIFREVVITALQPIKFPPSQMLVAVPAYSEDISKLIQSLQAAPEPFIGYSLGILGLSSEFLKPITTMDALPNSESQKTEPLISDENSINNENN